MNKNNLTEKYKYIFPNGYSNINPVSCTHGMSKTNSSLFYPMFSPSPRNLEIVKIYLKGIKKKIITITIRNSFFIKKRNSNFNDWIKFASYLKKNFSYCFTNKSKEYPATLKLNKIDKKLHIKDLKGNLNIRAMK